MKSRFLAILGRLSRSDLALLRTEARSARLSFSEVWLPVRNRRG